MRKKVLTTANGSLDNGIKLYLMTGALLFLLGLLLPTEKAMLHA